MNMPARRGKRTSVPLFVVELRPSLKTSFSEQRRSAQEACWFWGWRAIFPGELWIALVECSCVCSGFCCEGSDVRELPDAGWKVASCCLPEVLGVLQEVDGEVLVQLLAELDGELHQLVPVLCPLRHGFA